MFSDRSLYVPGTGWLYKLHPLTKLTYTLTVCLVIFTTPWGGVAAFSAGLLTLALAGWAGLLKPILVSLGRTLLPLGVLLVIVHGLFNPDNQQTLWIIAGLPFGREGLEFALLVFTRLAAASAASLLSVFSTTPSELIAALSQAGLPPKLTYILASPLMLLPQFADRAKGIIAVQSARGLETRGNLLIRTRALFPLIAPLIFNALLDVEERALALELRGFNAPGPRTHFHVLPDSHLQKFSRGGMLIFGLLVAVGGIWWRLYGAH